MSLFDGIAKISRNIFEWQSRVLLGEMNLEFIFDHPMNEFVRKINLIAKKKRSFWTFIVGGYIVKIHHDMITIKRSLSFVGAHAYFYRGRMEPVDGSTRISGKFSLLPGFRFFALAWLGVWLIGAIFFLVHGLITWGRIIFGYSFGYLENWSGTYSLILVGVSIILLASFVFVMRLMRFISDSPNRILKFFVSEGFAVKSSLPLTAT